MRKIEENIVTAFTERRTARQGNTSTDGRTLYLHGNAIAQHVEHGSGLQITNAGWDTRTTQSRLNALGSLLGHRFSVYTRQFEQRVTTSIADRALTSDWQYV